MYVSRWRSGMGSYSSIVNTLVVGRDNDEYIFYYLLLSITPDSLGPCIVSQRRSELGSKISQPL